MTDRRQAERLPVAFYARQMVDDEPYRCFTTNLSSTGLYLERVRTPLDRARDTVQIELPLPGTGELVWARADVVYDCVDSLFHGTALRFTGMARKHRRMLRDWLTETRVSRTTELSRLVHREAGVDIFRPPPRRVMPRACRGLWRD